MANFEFNTFTVTTSALEVLAGNSRRRGNILHNNSSVTIFWGLDNSVTVSNGMPLLPSATLFNSGNADAYRGPIFVIVAAGTANLRFNSWNS